MTRAEKVIAFIERYCITPDGMNLGKPIVLDPFQKDFIYAVYDNPHGTRKALLSMGRKNGKSALIACLVLCHLVGTEAVQNSDISSGAQSRDNAAIIFNLCVKMISMSDELKKIINIVPSTKKLTGLPMNVTYQALSADGRRNMGGSPIFAILDEVGQVVGSRNHFIDAVTTSQGAHANPLLVAISTQAANDADLFSLWIDDALSAHDKHTICHIHRADEDCDLMDEAQWRKANPALGSFRSIDEIRKMAGDAQRMPSFENAFRNLYLNQRIAANSPFISRGAWQDCAGEPCPIEECSELFGGLDLSAKTDLTAFVLVGHHIETDTWNVYPYFWTPQAGLLERANRDRAPYDMWAKDGYIYTTPGATVGLDFVGQEMAQQLADYPIAAIAYDRWRMDVLKKELSNIGVDAPLHDWGQGFKDMAPALEALEEMILNKSLRHGGHPVLTMCAANSVVVRNPAGDRKLDKAKASGRIDGMVALAMACGIAARKAGDAAYLDEIINNPLSF